MRQLWFATMRLQNIGNKTFCIGRWDKTRQTDGALSSILFVCLFCFCLFLLLLYRTGTVTMLVIITVKWINSSIVWTDTYCDTSILTSHSGLGLTDSISRSGIRNRQKTITSRSGIGNRQKTITSRSGVRNRQKRMTSQNLALKTDRKQ